VSTRVRGVAVDLKVDRRPKRYYIDVFPASPIVVAVFLVIYAVAGAAIGALTGWVASLITKRGLKGMLRDASLGSFGFLLVLVGCIFMPWPRNTIVEKLEGGGSVATTMNTYQHPERVAIVVAILLPVLYEFYRFKRARAN
jgi:hypothetical protein